MHETALLPFDLPAVARKKLTVDFDGGNQSSNGGALLLGQAEARNGICRRIAEAMPDRRDPTRTVHAMHTIVAARVFAICCGHADAIDMNLLRDDPAMKLALGRLPESGTALASQSTATRMENAPRRSEALRVTAAPVDHFAETVKPSPRNIFDIDDAFLVAHGGQQMAFWNAHQDERGFAPFLVYHAESGAPVVAVLRPARTPKGSETRTLVRHLTERIRRQPLWQTARLVWRGDGHYGRDEVMDWCENNDCDYVFGLGGNKVLDRLVSNAADHLLFWHALSEEPKVRCYTEVEYAAKGWSRRRRVIARIEVSLEPDPESADRKGMRQSLDIRYVVTSLAGRPQHIYEDVYCQRGQAENLIKLHKVQCSAQRTSCHSANANQIRLVLATAAYWLMHTVRNAIPATAPLAKAEFRTIRERLLKIGTRVVEFGHRIRVHLPTSCPDRALFRTVALALLPTGS